MGPRLWNPINGRNRGVDLVRKIGPPGPNNTFAGDPHFLDCPETLVAILENVVFLVVSILNPVFVPLLFTGVDDSQRSCRTNNRIRSPR